jgi:hypothetical protein
MTVKFEVHPNEKNSGYCVLLDGYDIASRLETLTIGFFNDNTGVKARVFAEYVFNQGEINIQTDGKTEIALDRTSAKILQALGWTPPNET